MRARLAALVVACAAAATGCDQRSVVPLSSGGGGGWGAPPRTYRIDKLDLLFVVDNSISMADKQSELGRRIPELIASLTDPTPDPKTGRTSNVVDIHVGVITSSLGSHGTSACAVEISNRANNDMAHLLPRSGEGGGTGFAAPSTGDTVTAAACPTPVTASPISWAFDPSASADYLGATGATQFGTAASCIVQSAREQGCGYEESLEAMYHFLIDPTPYQKAEVACTFGVSGDACGSNKIVVEGTDSILLAQRAAFLRPDSAVVIVHISDENDVSLKPAGLNWLPWGYGKGQMMRGWASCKSVPDSFEPETAADFMKLHNDYNCFSCFEKGDDPNCKVPWATDPLNNDVDARNLRGFQMVQRFGYNFLWGRQRYVDGLTKSLVMDKEFKLVTNPLFAGGMRGPANIIFAAIAGVPPNLVSNPDGTAKVLTAADWQKIAGDTGRDPHMIESIAPRAGIPKYAGDRTVDPVNGGDRNISDGADLQYACIAPRTSTSSGNDCVGTSPHLRSPLCNSDGTQAYYKAYPGLRQLRVARDVNGYAASICQPRLGDALKGLVTRLRPLME